MEVPVKKRSSATSSEQLDSEVQKKIVTAKRSEKIHLNFYRYLHWMRLKHQIILNGVVFQARCQEPAGAVWSKYFQTPLVEGLEQNLSFQMLREIIHYPIFLVVF